MFSFGVVLFLCCILSIIPNVDAIKTYLFESLSNNFIVEILDDLTYSGRIEYDGGLIRSGKEITIMTKWFNADKLMFYIEHLDIKGKRRNCTDTYLQVFDVKPDKSIAKGLEEKICGNETINGNFVGISNALTFKYVTPGGIPAKWSIIFTAFHEGHCMSYEYRCKNEKCISHSLRCDGNNPCGDDSDCLMTYGAMAAIALGGICALASTLAVIFVIYKNRKTLYRRHRRQPNTFTPARSIENLTAADFCQEAVTSLNSPSLYAKC